MAAGGIGVSDCSLCSYEPEDQQGERGLGEQSPRYENLRNFQTRESRSAAFGQYRPNIPSDNKLIRHTYAGLMIADGTPLVVVSRRLGHAQVSTTANIYAHVIASADEKAAQVAEKFADVVAVDPPQKRKRMA